MCKTGAVLAVLLLFALVTLQAENDDGALPRFKSSTLTRLTPRSCTSTCNCTSGPSGCTGACCSSSCTCGSFGHGCGCSSSG
uniref:Ctr_11_TN conopeptide n=1 Tax=Conus tribblei TaxID=101761 RepID=A0A0C9R708_CONTD